MRFISCLGKAFGSLTTFPIAFLISATNGVVCAFLPLGLSDSFDFNLLATFASFVLISLDIKLGINLGFEINGLYFFLVSAVGPESFSFVLP